MKAAGHLIIDYTALLHRYGVDSEVSINFRNKHQYNTEFVNRAQAMDRLFRERDNHALIEME